jgi:hypothetical protein
LTSKYVVLSLLITDAAFNGMENGIEFFELISDAFDICVCSDGGQIHQYLRDASSYELVILILHGGMILDTGTGCKNQNLGKK